MRQFLWLGCLFCCLVCVSCTSAKSKTTSSQIPPLENGEVERVYGLYQQGQYAAYVAEMASCDNTPENYRKQMADLHKQHSAMQQEKVGGVVSARVVKLTPSANGHLGCVHNLAIVNNVTRNIGLHVSFQIRVFIFFE